MKKPKKKQSINKHRAKADKVFSIYIRQKGMDWKGIQTCFTCGVKKPWKELQCSHFISRSANATRFSEINCRPACVGCNVFKHGNIPTFAQKLLKELGQKKFNDLIDLGRSHKSFTHEELDSIIERYKDLT